MVEECKDPTRGELARLIKYLYRAVRKGFDLSKIGVNIRNIDSVKKFWRRHCYCLTISECIDELKNIIPVPLRAPEEEDPESLFLRYINDYSDYAARFYEEHYGTSDPKTLLRMFPQLYANYHEHLLGALLHPRLYDKFKCDEVHVLTIPDIVIFEGDPIATVDLLRGKYTITSDYRILEDFIHRQVMVAYKRDTAAVYCVTKTVNKEPVGFPVAPTRRALFVSLKKQIMVVIEGV